MYRYLFLTLVLSCSLLPLPVNADSNYLDHPYDIFEDYRLGFMRRTSLNQQGFGNLSEGFSAVSYFSNLALSNKKTEKGNYYGECRFSFHYGLELRSYFPRDSNQDENFGFYITPRYEFRFISGKVQIYSTRVREYVNSFDFVKDYNQDMNEGLDHQSKHYSQNIKYYTNNVRVNTRLSWSRFIDLGCDQAPIEEEKSSDCPNLIIRGLPFIRNTITCH